MKTHIDWIKREPEKRRVLVKGWAESPLMEAVKITASPKDNVERMDIIRHRRKDKEDILDKRNSAFELGIQVKNFDGALRLRFDDGKSRNTVLIPLSADTVLHVKDVDSPFFGVFSEIEKIRPSFSRQDLKNLVKSNLPEYVVKPLKDCKNKLESGFFHRSEYQKWMRTKEHTVSPEEAKKEIRKFKSKPMFSLLIPVTNKQRKGLKKLVLSIEKQEYPNWQICAAVAQNARTDTALDEIKSLAREGKAKIAYAQEEPDLSKLSDLALNLADGEYVALLDEEGVLSKDALFEAAKVLNKDPKLDVIYADEDRIGIDGLREDYYFKPDFSPDTLLSSNYMGPFTLIRTSLAKKAGGFKEAGDGAPGYDLILRSTEITREIKHLPRVLYHALSSRFINREAEKKAILHALKRRKTPGRVKEGAAAGFYDVTYDVLGDPSVDIIIPTKNNPDVLSRCVESIVSHTTWKNYQIHIVDNGSTDPKTIELFKRLKREVRKLDVLPHDVPFNFSEINNWAVKKTEGDYLLFLNDDTEVLTEGWIENMLGFAQLDYVGAVGGRLLYPDRTVQHAGVVIGLGESQIAGHIHTRADAHEIGYFGKLQSVTDYSAVTGACLMVQREKFNSVGGFDEKLTVNYNDIDLCLKLYKKGYFNIYDPQVELYHYESLSRGQDLSPEKKKRRQQERLYFSDTWGDLLTRDPMYNVNLSLRKPDYSPNLEADR